MPDSAFKQPVLLFSPNPDGTVRRVELATVQEGIPCAQSRARRLLPRSSGMAHGLS